MHEELVRQTLTSYRANYFFYFGTVVFAATGLQNSYVTSIILGTVNVAATIAGLWIVMNVGRRKAMMAGAAWMGMCLFIYSFVGHFQLDHANPQNTPQAGNIMIVFTCLFIAAFATTWGPLVWTIVGELVSNIGLMTTLILTIGPIVPCSIPCNRHGPCNSQQLALQLPDFLLLYHGHEQD